MSATVTLLPWAVAIEASGAPEPLYVAHADLDDLIADLSDIRDRLRADSIARHPAHDTTADILALARACDVIHIDSRRTS